MRPFLITAMVLLAFLPGARADLPAATFGAKGDGAANDAPAIQNAMDAAAKAGGGRVTLEGKQYRLDGPLVVPGGVTLAGVWDGPHFPPNGTVLLAVANKGHETGPAQIQLAGNATLRGVTLFYPDQSLNAVIPYPWAIEIRGTNDNVMDVTLVNPVKGIDAGTHPNELHYIRNVFGCPLRRGILVDQCTDVGRIENVHFNPNFWTRSGMANAPQPDDLTAYLGRNCTSFELGRSDWEFMTNTFSFGCRVGYRFFHGATGECNGNFIGIAADWAGTAVRVEQTQPPGLLITNGEFVGNAHSEAMVDILPSHTGVAQFSNCSFWGPAKRAARVDGTGRASFLGCNFVQWDAKNAGIEAVGGDVDVSHCQFLQKEGVAVALGKGVPAATVQGNHGAGPVRVENHSGGDVSITGNVGRKP